MTPMTNLDRAIKTLQKDKKAAENRIRYSSQEIEEKTKEHAKEMDELRGWIEQAKESERQISEALHILEQSAKESE